MPRARVDGDMAFEWQDSCDGWSVNQRSPMAFFIDGGETTKINWSLVSWEAKDGRRYRFFMRTRAAKLTDEFRGDARSARRAAAPTPRPDGRRRAAERQPVSVRAQPRADPPSRRRDASLGDHVRRIRRRRTVRCQRVIAPARAPRPARPSRAAAEGRARPSRRAAFFAPEGRRPSPSTSSSSTSSPTAWSRPRELDYGDFTVLAALKEAGAAADPKC